MIAGDREPSTCYLMVPMRKNGREKQHHTYFAYSAR